MAAIKLEDESSHFNPGPTNCVDPLDIEQYINPDSLAFPSPSPSPSASYKTPTIATPTASSRAIAPPPTQQTFAAPSHQYEQYKQQSSLPVGAVANTFALNESDQYSYGHDDYLMAQSGNLYAMDNADDYIDFGTSPAGPVDTNMDYTLSSQQSSLAGNSFIDPSAVGGLAASPIPRSSTQPMRAWPGMHQQQADMQAKAQAEAQARQQQARQESLARSRASSHPSQPASETHVEQSISRLLDRMRHSSVSSSHNGDHGSPDGGSYLGRKTKDEEDMDEDERLLASEEGKKLSSKERRQLRNKVSARAFRSRRKEYIGQLEGEIAQKTVEADELRLRNQQLSAENSRLTDLTRMLLSSSHFSSFLNELSASGGSMPSLTQNASNSQQPSQQSVPRKDVNTTQHQNSVQAGLAMIPESPYEFDNAESTTNGWASSSNLGFDQQVYAVTAIPEEPVVDVDALRGKSIIEPLSSYGSTKEELPDVDTIPELLNKTQLPEPVETPAIDEDIHFDESDPALVLYGGQSCSIRSTEPAIGALVDAEDRIFGDIALEKALGRIEITISDNIQHRGEPSAAAVERFERTCSKMDEIGARIDAAIAHR